MINATRIKGFADRSRWLGAIMGNPVVAGLHWVRVKFDQKIVADGRYGGYGFAFRGMDMPILREIIHEREYAFLDDLLRAKEAPIIVDVGAHIGLFALWVLAANPRSRVLSVEASPDTYSILSANAAKARQGGIVWNVLNRAAWGDNSEIRFSEEGSSMTRHVSMSGGIDVRGITIGEVLDQAAGVGQGIALMKIDIEGAEESFLCAEGAEESFLCAAPDALDRIEALVIELHNGRCDTVRVRALLERKFSKIEERGGRGSSKPLLYCRK